MNPLTRLWMSRHPAYLSARNYYHRQTPHQACRYSAATPLQQLEKLDPMERRQVLQLIDAFIERGQLKRKAQNKQAA